MQKSELLSIALAMTFFGLGLVIGAFWQRWRVYGGLLFFLVGILISIIWFYYPATVPIASNVPVLSATAMPKGDPGLLLGNIAPIPGDKTSQWDVDISVPDCMIAPYDRSKPENDQRNHRFVSKIENAGQFHTRVGTDGPILFWIMPTSLALFAGSSPMVVLTLNSPDGQRFSLTLPIKLLNLPH